MFQLVGLQVDQRATIAHLNARYNLSHQNKLNSSQVRNQSKNEGARVATTWPRAAKSEQVVGSG